MVSEPLRRFFLLIPAKTILGILTKFNIIWMQLRATDGNQIGGWGAIARIDAMRSG